MAGQNDFLIFDENQDNMLTQEIYATDSDRTDGFQTGLARSNVTNKVLHQTSMMCHAIGECIKDIDGTATDSGSVSDLKDAIKNALQGDFSRNIGEIVASAIPLTNAELHLFDGALIQGSGIYSAGVAHIAGLRTSYPYLFTTEALWQQSVTTYGVCGKFVYDSVNNTVRLPKITGIVEGTTDLTALGDLVEAGLPNITGLVDYSAYGYYNNNYNNQGAFKNSTKSTATGNANQLQGGGDNNGTYRKNTLIFNASDDNVTYGNSNTVQPQTIKILYYIVLATSTKTDIEVDIDDIATDLNGKADVDLTNVNDSGTSLGASWAFPSYTFITPTVGASGSTYTAPANGWLVLSGTCTADHQFVNIIGRLDAVCFGVNTKNVMCWIPILKGLTATIYYNTTDTALKFVYAVGSESEA